MKYVLDTNIISEIMKPRPDHHVINWLQDHNEQVFLNAVSIQELYYGIFLMPDSKRKAEYKETMDAIVRECADRSYYFDSFCGYLCAESHANSRKLARAGTIEDFMIAAICQRNSATLVTRNVKDFEYLGVEVVNPFDYESPTLKRLREQER